MQPNQYHAVPFFIPAPSPKEAIPDSEVIQVDEETWRAYCQQKPSPLIDWIESPEDPPHTEVEWFDWLHHHRGGGSLFLADWVQGDLFVATRFVGTVVEGELVIYETQAVDMTGPTPAEARLLIRRCTPYAAEARRNHAEVFAQVKAERGTKGQGPAGER